MCLSLFSFEEESKRMRRIIKLPMKRKKKQNIEAVNTKKTGKKQPDGQKIKLNGALRATGFCCESQFC